MPCQPGDPEQPGLQQKTVVEVEAEGNGFIVELSCGHIVWFAVEQKPGDLAYCGVCLDEVRKAMFPAMAK